MPRRGAFLAIAALLGPATALRAEDGDNALVRAIRANDIEGVRAALAHGGADRRIAYAATPLALAVNTQNAAMVDLLLARHADPNEADAEGLTPLSLACELGGADIIDRLIDAGADVRKAGPDGATPLAVCARFAPADTVARMLAKGAPADAVDTRGQTPLMWAASAGNDDAVRALLKAGAQVGRVTTGGFTPLFFAIKGGAPSTVKLLQDAGADAGFRGPENTSALQLALYQKQWSTAALLLEGGTMFDLAEIDRNGQQPLHVAAGAGEVDLVKLLLRKGANANGLTGTSRVKWVTEANFGMPPPPVPPTPPLLFAAQHGQAGTMRALVAGGADKGFVAEDGTNVLLAAAKGKDAAALAYALDLAPDANVTDANGITPLTQVLLAGLSPDLEKMLRLLHAHGARTDIAAKKGFTADKLAQGGLSEVKTIYDAVFTPSSTATATPPSPAPSRKAS